jgi:hypothetical protein
LENQRERGWRETRERSGERLLGSYKEFPVTQENEEQEKNFQVFDWNGENNEGRATYI